MGMGQKLSKEVVEKEGSDLGYQEFEEIERKVSEEVIFEEVMYECYCGFGGFEVERSYG